MNNLLKYIEKEKGYSLSNWEKQFYSENYPTIEIYKKAMIYQSISDISKELTGCRHRLDIDQYSIQQLQSILDEYINDFKKEAEREREKQAEDFVEAKLLAKKLNVTIEDLQRWEVV
jgi:DNA repair ATPase RecN